MCLNERTLLYFKLNGLLHYQTLHKSGYCPSIALTKFVQASLLIYRPRLSGLIGARGLSCSVYTGSKSTSCRVGDLWPMEKAPLDAAVE